MRLPLSVILRHLTCAARHSVRSAACLRVLDALAHTSTSVTSHAQSTRNWRLSAAIAGAANGTIEVQEIGPFREETGTKHGNHNVLHHFRKNRILLHAGRMKYSQLRRALSPEDAAAYVGSKELLCSLSARSGRSLSSAGTVLRGPVSAISIHALTDLRLVICFRTERAQRLHRERIISRSSGRSFA